MQSPCTAMDAQVKQELIDTENPPLTKRNDDGVSKPVPVIDLSSSDSDDSDDSDGDDDDVLGENGKRFRVLSDVDGGVFKRQKLAELGVIVPLGFLDPLPPEVPESVPQRPLSPPAVSQRHSTVNANASLNVVVQGCKQFWKAGDYEGAPCGDWNSQSVGMDHVRVHPKFLHSNATSHKWALGAFAELLDNSLDEICNGSTYVNIDMLESKKDGSRMLLIEDNGGGMDPDKVRQCMSLGYSAKSKLANTIGQYGNGFKTSTMRLGADVIVFSRCCGIDGKSPTQSIGLLSYTFLRSTGKEDIVVPMLDYERGGREWKKIIRTSLGDWNTNVETIVHWSPFSTEADLLRQFNLMKDHGTRIIIYNLWEDDQGLLELDFDADKHDIQIRGVNRDEKNIQMAQQFPNSRHFLTYRHSLRSYASILYLRLSPGFRIILRGKDVEHHNIVNDMMLTQEVTYRPQPVADGIPKDLNMVAVVTIGFVKDAKHHIDVQGFNVYHKNRLIKPFWRLWNAAGSDGRGVIGVLEANFVEPAHDKQGFERTTVLARLESRLVQMQKTYWSSYCHKIGYAPRRNKKVNDMSVVRETSPDYLPQTFSQPKKKYTASSSRTPNSNSDKVYSQSNQKYGGRESEKSYKTMDGKYRNGHLSSKKGNRKNAPTKSGNRSSSPEPSSHSEENDSDDDVQIAPPEKRENGSHHKTLNVKKSSGKDGSHTTRSSLFVENSEAQRDCGSGGRTVQTDTTSLSKGDGVTGNVHSPSDSNAYAIDQLKEENRELRERLKKKEDEILRDLLRDLHSERERCKSLETQLQEALQKIDNMNKEQESLIDIFSEERDRRDIEEENLRKKLKEASNTIQELLDKVRLLEKMKSPNSRTDR